MTLSVGHNWIAMIFLVTCPRNLLLHVLVISSQEKKIKLENIATQLYVVRSLRRPHEENPFQITHAARPSLFLTHLGRHLVAVVLRFQHPVYVVDEAAHGIWVGRLSGDDVIPRAL